MRLLDKILVAVDFTPTSEETVKIATGLAKNFDANVILVHILPPKNHEVKPLSKLLKKLSQKKMNKMKKEMMSEGVKNVDIVLKRGVHLYDILELADTKDANLIILGAGEKEDGDSFRLGTTAEKVIKEARIPVWTVKQHETDEIKNIVCPVDLSPVSKRALQEAIHLARRFNAKLTILNVVDIISDDYTRLGIKIDDQMDDLSKKHLMKLNKFLEKFDFYNVDYQKVIRSKSPAKEILGLIKEIDADLLVIGTTGKTGLSRILFGSVTEKVIREVPCSFITLKTEDMFKIKLETELKDIEAHYKLATQYLENGFTKEAVNEFKHCILVNDLHLPSWEGLAKAYDRLGKKGKAKATRKTALEIQQRIWNIKIEAEIRSRNELFGRS